MVINFEIQKNQFLLDNFLGIITTELDDLQFPV